MSFRYGSRLVLNDVSFSVKPGQMVGIVGHTGSGKSTVSNLICRFYDASSGAVLVDGTDIRRIGLADYRRHIGIVLQDPFLFFGTIGDNVAYGVPEAGAARVIDAARAARAHEFVLKLPKHTIPWLASAASPCPGASASASPSRARFWSIPRS
ncbi:MAG: ATP-binding cassette domain-containing protein [Pseudomonadota bacterium]